MSTLRDLPESGSLCARFADALPLYTSGELAPEETSALSAHLETCDTCRERLAGYDQLDSALRRHVGVPSNAAPFLSFDSIVTRTRSADATPTPESAPIAAQPGEPPLADARSVAFAAKGMRRGVRPIHEEDIMFDQHDTPPSATRVAEPGAHRHRRLRGIAAFAAAVALVALAVAVFQSFGPSHRTGNGKGNKQATNAPATHYLGASGKWDTVGTYQNNSVYGTPIIAQTNPNEMFETGASLAVRRSMDGGSTWTTLHAPTQDVPEGPSDVSAGILVSPLDARTVFLMIFAGATDPKCPTPIVGMPSRPHHIGAKVALSGGYSCSFEYVSRDGGDTWQSLNVPSAGHVGGPFQANSGFQVQGDSLYSTLVPDLNGPAPLGYRLVKSSDGVNWQYADADLAARGQNVSQIVAASSGGELFAVTVPAGGINGGGAYTPQLWHSADGGAHWTEVGAFPQAGDPTYAQLIGVTTNASGRAQVYEYTHASGQAYERISVSADGGRTWQPVTYQGLPADLTQSNSAGSGAHPTPSMEMPGMTGPRLQFLGSLADGSPIVEYAQNNAIPLGTPGTSGGMGYMLSNSHVTYYALTPGSSAWTQLTPQLKDGYVTTQWLSPASNGHPAAIYVMQMQANPNVLQSSNGGASTATLSRCELTK